MEATELHDIADTLFHLCQRLPIFVENKAHMLWLFYVTFFIQRLQTFLLISDFLLFTFSYFMTYFRRLCFITVSLQPSVT